jgi:hypothetical protein
MRLKRTSACSLILVLHSLGSPHYADQRISFPHVWTLFGNPMLSYYVDCVRPNVISNGAKRNEKSSNTLAAPRPGRNEPSELPILLLVTSSTSMIEDFSPKGTIVAALEMT